MSPGGWCVRPGGALHRTSRYLRMAIPVINMS